MTEQSDLPRKFDFENHRLHAIEEYQKIRPLYFDYANVAKSVLSEAFKVKHIKVHSIEARAKDIDSFGIKAAKPSPDDPSRPHYPNPLQDITDLAGIRVILFLPDALVSADSLIQEQFEVVEKSDKALMLIKEGKFGYGSIHYLARFKDNRTNLLEYSRYKGLTAEIQVRTILQHAWAEIEHDIQYKAVEVIPNTIRRRFMSLAGMLEIADREFQAIQDDDERLRTTARKSVQEGKLERVEITPDALRTYLNKKVGADRRVSDFSYEWTAKLLRNLGFTDFEQIEDCVRGFDDDQLSRIALGTRPGPTSRFEYLLLAGMGENYIDFHLWRGLKWFINSQKRILADFKHEGIMVGSYIPPGRRVAE